MSDHERAQVDELLRHNSRLLCRNHNSGSKVSLLTYDSKERVGKP
jgi:hypothetical protein